MKSLAGALMDCLIIPVQGRLEEWRRITGLLDKDHAKDYKKYRAAIKKKTEQATRYFSLARSGSKVGDFEKHSNSRKL